MVAGGGGASKMRASLITTTASAKSATPYIDINKFAFLTGVDAEPLPNRRPQPPAAQTARHARSSLGAVLFGGGASRVANDERALLSVGATASRDPIEVALSHPIVVVDADPGKVRERSGSGHRPQIGWAPGESAALAICDRRFEQSDEGGHSGAGRRGEHQGAAVRMRSTPRAGQSIAQFYGARDADVAIAEDPPALIPIARCAEASSLSRAVRGRQKTLAVVEALNLSDDSSSQQPLSHSQSLSGAFNPRLSRSTPQAASGPSAVTPEARKEAVRSGGAAGPSAGGDGTAELHAAVSDKAAMTLRSFGFAAEMQEMTAARDLLPRSCHYQHLHSLDAITEVRGAHNIANAPRTGASHDIAESLGDDGDGGGVVDAAPVALQWHYLLRKDAAAAARREAQILQARTLQRSTKHHHQASTQADRAAGTGGAKSCRSKGRRRRHSQEVLESTSGQSDGTVAAHLGSDDAQRAGPWTVSDLAFMADELMREKSTMTRVERRDTDPEFEQAAAARRIKAIQSSTIDEVGADAVAQYILYTKDPQLFSLTGEDTDVTRFPNFPFAVDAQNTASGGGGGGGLPSDRTQQKFERGLLTRQLQRNRKLVDDRDNPALDWAAWRGAAAAAFSASHSASKVTATDVADRMQFQWRSVCDDRGVHDLPCHGADRLAREAVLLASHEREGAGKGGAMSSVPKLPSIARAVGAFTRTK